MKTKEQLIKQLTSFGDKEKALTEKQREHIYKLDQKRHAYYNKIGEEIVEYIMSTKK